MRLPVQELAGRGHEADLGQSIAVEDEDTTIGYKQPNT